MNIIATYNSDWGTCTVTSDCQIDTNELRVTEIKQADVDGLDLDHCEREYIEVQLNNGETIELPVEDGDLTQQGRNMLKESLPLIPQQKFTSMVMNMVKVPGSMLDTIQSQFDCFSRTQDADEIILDAVSLGEEEISNLSFILGFDAEPLAGGYVTFNKG